jgi:magnesium transporter
MIKAYNFDTAALVELTPDDLQNNLTNSVWVDLVNPTSDEEIFIEKLLNISIPTREEIREIELSSRLYQSNGTVFSTISIVTKADTKHPESHHLTFIHHDKWLVIVRYIAESPYHNVLAKTKLINKSPHKANVIFSMMLEDITEQLADILENITKHIDRIGHTIFKYDYESKSTTKSKPEFRHIIAEIGHNEDLLSRARESLFTISRMLGFVLQTSYFHAAEDKHPITMIMRDTSSLIEHTTFLSNKITFLLDATLGMINIEQNSIIKIVSVAAVVFLPPTGVASIYGMNFHHMPELSWEYGYPFGLLLMVLSGFLPYRFFKHKGWL